MNCFVQVRTPSLLIKCIFSIAFFIPVFSFAQVNNLCGSATVLISAPGCFNTAGTLVGSTYTVIPNACGGGGGNRNDVWYSFTAKSSNPTITLSGAITANQPSIQLYSNCGGTLGPAPNCVTNNPVLTTSGLVPGTTYLVRVFSNNNTSTTFNICITDSYNLCASAVTLTSGTSCTNIPGNMYGSTLTAITITAPDCAVGVTRDVWYQFVAQTTNPTITLSSIGAGFINPSMQLLSNNCGGTFTPYFCGTTSIAANFLTPGTTYFIRVYSTGAAPASPAVGGFNICITDPVSTAPNDDCTGAANISVNNACNTIPGDMAGATPSAPALSGSCTGPLVYDVWYKFTAINNTATVNLGSIGTNFINPGIEVFSGNCGALTSIACGNNPLLMAGTLTAGTTYYVRVYSRTAPLPNGDAGFDICITSSVAPVVRFGNSYINISKKTTGGVVQPGDTLEIRMAIQHTTATTMTNLRFVDNIPTKTAMLTGAADRIRVLTNEGLVYKQYTLAASDDAATYKALPAAGEFNIRMNLGFGGSNPGIQNNATNSTVGSATGTMSNADRPTLFGSSLLFVAAYRVVVTGVVGDTITLNPAKFIYRTGGSDITLTATSYKILISSPLTLCTNSIGLNVAAESGGTFGSGTAPNRGSDLVNPIAGYSFVNNVNANNNVGDGRYAIVKNMSPRNSTNKNANFARACAALAFNDPLNCNNRMFDGHWYIDGDHTGTNNAAGNAPPAATTSGGYMLEVNADYVASQVYSQTIINLCPNTYYEFSAWFRNICPTCGADSTGAQFAGTPTAPTNGYPGVKPNLSFALDGLDYYSTGEMDTIGWLKKGFVFKTNPLQTSATFSIRNNSQGGGGNDWTMDDIAVATCFPNMTYSPTSNPTVCQNNTLTIYDTVRSYFDNYVEYKWQRSINGGGSWSDISGSTGTATPVWNGSAYQYIRSYSIPPANTTPANDGDLYRLVVASTTSNLGGTTCSYTDPTSITLDVLTNCGPVLKCDLLSFNGNLMNGNAVLSWSTSREDEPVHFDVEKSDDGISFIKIGSVNGRNNSSYETNSYSFIDPNPVTTKEWYRIILINTADSKKYSRIIQLGKSEAEFKLENVINPFNSELSFNVVTSRGSKINVELIDMQGKNVKSFSYLVYTGTNSIRLDNTGLLSPGVYTLHVQNNDKIIVRKVVKKNN